MPHILNKDIACTGTGKIYVFEDDLVMLDFKFFLITTNS